MDGPVGLAMGILEQERSRGVRTEDSRGFGACGVASRFSKTCVARVDGWTAGMPAGGSAPELPSNASPVRIEAAAHARLPAARVAAPEAPCMIVHLLDAETLLAGADAFTDRDRMNVGPKLLDASVRTPNSA
jgi:hypothetical protein